VQISTINPGPFRTGFNDRMYDTLDQWYEPAKNFTPEQPIRDVQNLFGGDKLQLDPQDMIDFMIETIPQDEHKFRNVFPERFIDDVKQYQESIWDLKTSPGLAKKTAAQFEAVIDDHRRVCFETDGRESCSGRRQQPRLEVLAR
jgi:hypothetical protein